MLTLPADLSSKDYSGGSLRGKTGSYILGLGAMTSVVGDAWITVAKPDIAAPPVTAIQSIWP